MLERGNAERRQGRNFGDLVERVDAGVEGEIDDRVLLPPCHDVVENGQIGVEREQEDQGRGHPAERGGARLGVEISGSGRPVDAAGPEMDVGIDEARDDIAFAGLDPSTRRRKAGVGPDGDDALALDGNASADDPARRNDQAVADHRIDRHTTLRCHPGSGRAYRFAAVRISVPAPADSGHAHASLV